MDTLSGKVAVVTGGASGIGLALADRFVREGARVVVADIEAGAQEAACERLRAAGGEVLGVHCDVGEAADVEALKAATLDAFGAVHVVCNNAGVGGGGFIDQIPLEKWEWLVRVNLFGVIHGVHAFLPHLLDQDEGHILNTASILGLVASPISAPYAVTKYGVVALSESLHHELGMRSSNVGVTVLCPGWVATNIHDSERNIPAHLRDAVPADDDAGKAMFRSIIEGGMDPVEVADRAVDAVLAGRFWVLTGPANAKLVSKRSRAIVAGDPPPLAMPE